MSATVYAVGDTLFERGHERRGNRLVSVVREWTVLSTVPDPLYLDGDRPIQVVTMRAFVRRRAVYVALMDVELDTKMQVGRWSREQPKEKR